MPGHHREAGFTLIELMVTVAIIGILAVVAVANFTNYQRKAKSSEAQVCLYAIAMGQLAYNGEVQGFVACAANPAGSPGRAKRAWQAANADFARIGFAPKDGLVYYQYASTSVDPGHDFTATATGDLDGDGVMAVFQIEHNTPFSGPAIAGAF